MGETISRFARAAVSVTAGGSGDNTEIVGDTINLQTLEHRPSSVVFEIPVTATMAATETCVVVGEIEKSVDGSTWVDLVASATLLTLTGAAGGSTEKGVARLGADLVQSDCNFIRFKATPDCSRANTDVATVGAAVAVFGGLHRND
jgi:hypothetical protein